jgi:hypothetical protein
MLKLAELTQDEVVYDLGEEGYFSRKLYLWTIPLRDHKYGGIHAA